MKEFIFKRNNFDLIRLLAALQVVILHGHKHFEVEYGDSLIRVLSIFPGVTIFFVTSGFLISASFERSSSLGNYFQNRFLRIYPALWSCFIISIATVMIAYSPDFTVLDFGTWAAAQLTIGQFYNPEFLRGYGVGALNGSLWTIPVEIQFYLILPLLYVLFRKTNWNKYVLAGLMLLPIAVNIFYFSILQTDDEKLAYKLFRSTVFPYSYVFLLGVILQRNLTFVAKYLANNAHILLALYLVTIAIALMLGIEPQGTTLNPLSTLFLSLLTISVAYSKVGRFSNILKKNDISYGVYIYHMIFVNMLIQLNLFSPEINMIVMITLTVVTALLSWKLIEKPSLSFKRYSSRPSQSKKVIQHTA